jgi:maleate cis-trans isomerase
MGLADHEIAAVTPDTIYSFVQARVGPHIDGGGLFLAGTQWQAMSTLSLLKISYDVPVLTTNMAVLQAVKRAVDTLRDGAHAPGRAIS